MGRIQRSSELYSDRKRFMIDEAILLAEVVDLDNVGMAQVGDQLRLLTEAIDVPVYEWCSWEAGR